MNQKELNRAVARRTGETVGTIRHLGFNLEAEPDEFDHEACCLDWDEMEAISVYAIEESVFGEPVIACLF